MQTHLSTGEKRNHSHVRDVWEGVLSFLFPQTCIGCNVKNTPICGTCLFSIPNASEAKNAEVWSAFDYRGALIRKTVWQLKYKGNKKIAEIFAGVIYDKILEDLHEQQVFSSFDTPLLMPIPLSPKRRKERGFNQSEMLVGAIARLDNNSSFTPTVDVLIKIKDTPSQVSIKDRAARLRNVRDCFAVSDCERIAGKTIILIDDVTTTGATLHEAMLTLHKAGAKHVIARTVAH